MVDPKKSSKPAIHSSGIGVASAIDGTTHRGNPYHGSDGRFSTGGSVFDQFQQRPHLQSDDSIRAKPVKPRNQQGNAQKAE